MTTTNEKRINGIDALRAVAMLLGIVLHASIAYKVRTHKNWMHDTDFNSPLFDFTYLFIHSFRMPLFFLIGGFFCRMLYFKVGEASFIRHRWKRVAVPFLVSMVLIVPVSLIPYNFYVYHYKMGLDQDLALTRCYERLFKFSGLAHLWFLYYLLVYYVITVIIMRAGRIGAIGKLFRGVMSLVRSAKIDRIYWILIISIPMWLFLLPEKGLFVTTDTYVIPRRFNNLCFYGYTFLAGWALHIRMDLLAVMTRRFRSFLCVGAFLTCVLFYIDWNTAIEDNGRFRLWAQLVAVLQIFCLVAGFMGLFLYYFRTESRFWRYISDASYWVYLTHLIIVTGLQLLMLHSPVFGVLRFPIVMGVTTLITFMTYEYFVRYTLIGVFLHGPRKRPESRRKKVADKVIG
jgi:glucan biosynthesis protein C